MGRPPAYWNIPVSTGQENYLTANVIGGETWGKCFKGYVL